MAVIALADGTPRAAAALDVGPSPTLVVADWLSERTQEVLRSRRASFIDATGNADVRLTNRASSSGRRDRSANPRRSPKAPTLRGPKAWALLRTLVEVPPPLGVQELAAAVDVDAGYVSRVLAVLEQECSSHGPPPDRSPRIEWRASCGVVSATYSVFDSNETPRRRSATGGPERLSRTLPANEPANGRSLGASPPAAPVAAPEIAVVYADDVDPHPEAGLATTRGANVIVAEPYDPIVFDRTTVDSTQTYVSVAQGVAMDSLTGRSADDRRKARRCIAWMRKNEQRWRTGPLRPAAQEAEWA